MRKERIEEGRERLLTHFKSTTPESAPTPAPIVKMPRRDWSWAVPMGLAAALMAVVGGGLLLPVYSSRPEKRAYAHLMQLKKTERGFESRVTTRELADSAANTEHLFASGVSTRHGRAGS